MNRINLRDAFDFLTKRKMPSGFTTDFYAVYGYDVRDQALTFMFEYVSQQAPGSDARRNALVAIADCLMGEYSYKHSLTLGEFAKDQDPTIRRRVALNHGRCIRPERYVNGFQPVIEESILNLRKKTSLDALIAMMAFELEGDQDASVLKAIGQALQYTGTVNEKRVQAALVSVLDPKYDVDLDLSQRSQIDWLSFTPCGDSIAQLNEWFPGLVNRSVGWFGVVVPPV